MTRARFIDLLVSFRELPCGICSEEFHGVEFFDFLVTCICLLNRDSLSSDDLVDLFESEVSD